MHACCLLAAARCCLSLIVFSSHIFWHPARCCLTFGVCFLVDFLVGGDASVAGVGSLTANVVRRSALCRDVESNLVKLPSAVLVFFCFFLFSRGLLHYLGKHPKLVDPNMQIVANNCVN